ncbi:DUF2339 domain-containing protein [Sorangium sp. So ce693]|uniref:DUF2339 domain-containing protein n=1 Tax=Sorangium sp. So ce693 TaxID=3133318 RepID=UPI003F5D5702
MGAGIVVFFGLALVGYLLVAPLVAFVFAVRANRRNEDLLLRIHALEHRVAELSGHRGRAALIAAAESPRSTHDLEQERIAQGAIPPPAAPRPALDAEGADAPPALDAATTGVPPALDAATTGAPPALDATTASAPPALDATTAGAFPGIADPTATAPPALASTAFAAASTAAPPDVAFPGPAAPPPPRAPRPAATLEASAFGAGSPAHREAQERPSIEERLGLTWLTRAGATTFLLGALFFFKYASDNAWIGPFGRVAIGAATGAALLAIAEVLHGRAQRRFVHTLIGLGLSVLIASVWASATLYELVPIPAAFAADTVLLLLGAGLALRHRGEAILILSLVAGFLNPVVLSTGQDRPLVLFGYLLLMTSVVHAVAARLGFRVAPWLAIAGHTALFWGWYARHFDASAAPAGGDADAAPWLDSPAQALPGPYFALAARAAPLAFVALATAQGVLRALWLRRAPATSPDRSVPPTGAEATGVLRVAARADATATSIAALVLAHAGATALLFDAPRALTAAAITLALAALVALRAPDEGAWLLAPMGAGFLSFAATFADAPAAHRTTLVALVAAWTLVYLAGWLRGGAGLAGQLDRKTAIACSAGAALFACTAGMLLIEADAALFALALALAAALAAWTAARAALPALLLAAAILSAGALAAAAHFAIAPADAGASASIDAAGAAGAVGAVNASFLGASALVMLVFLGAAGASARRPREPGAPALSWSDALAACVATLGFVAAALGATPEDTPTLRALLTAGAGALDLALGAALLRAGVTRAEAAPPADRIALLLGQALALFAASAAFGLGGATVTVIWSILAAVAAAIAARTGERVWLAITLLLFAAALTRALVVDRAQAEALVTTWFATRGRDGTMAVPVLLNARTYAFTGVSAALLAAGRLLSRAAFARPLDAARAELRGAAAAALGAGYALLITTVVLEVRSAITALPAAPPAPLDASEFAELTMQHRAALEGQEGSLAMATTLVLALAAIALLTAGFAARDTFHRYAGLSLFAVTIAKLVAWDVWHVERIYQIALFTGVGALLVGGGFLYARFGRRLVTLLRAGSRGAAGPLALLAAMSLARPSEAQTGAALPIEKHALVRPIEGVDAAGDHRVDVDLDLYRESRAEELLADVRIAGPDGAEVPYVLREPGAAHSSGRIAATMLDPGVDAAGVAQATWALDAPGTRHCHVELSVIGGSFLREARVETGTDPRSLSEVARGAYVYRIPQGSETVEHLSVRYPLSRAALVRIRLVPEGAPARDAAADVRITGGAVSCETQAPAEAPALLPLAIVETQRDSEAKTTLVTLDAGADGAPLEAVLLDVSTPEFSRRVDVASTTYRAVWPAVGSGMIHRIRPHGESGPSLASTRVPLNPTRKRFLRLTIHDGDSAPLSLSGAQGEVRAREVVFRAARPGPHRLYVGDALGKRPSYDLVDLLDHTVRERPPAARLGAATANPALGAAPVARDLPFTERHRTAIGGALAVGLLALSLWAARLLKRGEQEQGERGAPPDDRTPPRQRTADSEPGP